jgi:hypothetical protein
MMFTSQVLLILSLFSTPPPMPQQPGARTAAGDGSVPLFYDGAPPSYAPIGRAHRFGGCQCSFAALPHR